MDTTKDLTVSKFNNVRSLALVPAGIAVNILLSMLSSKLGLPLYLDSIGTVISASLGGYIPGILVGLLTNGFKALSDPSSVYYGTINVLIALVAAYAARRKYYKSVGKFIMTILGCTFCGGVLGSVLTWFLYGFAQVGISSGLAQRIFDMGFMNEFMSQFTADVIMDLADKTITVAISAIVIVVLPVEFRRKFRMYGWRQSPLGHDFKAEVRNVVTGVASLRTKIIVLMSLAMIFIAIAAVSIGFVLYKRDLVETESKMAAGVADYVATLLDPEKIDEYLEQGHDAEEYDEIEAHMASLLASSPDIHFVYVYKMMEDGCHVVFDIESDGIEPEQPGDIVPYDEGLQPHIAELLEGKPLDNIITNDEYGWLLSVYVPVFDSEGNCVCYTCTDISVDYLRELCFSFLAKQISLFLGVFILILALGLWLAHYNLIVPVNSMAISAGEFAYESDETMEESVERLRDLDIHTGDEIENLYHAFVKTSEDSVHYVEDLEHKTETISKLQSGLILVLADMVESRDECTGDHVRKTAAYSGVILEGLRDLGYYSDIITDQFISDVINGAPLHDIGKIKVPDRILNSRHKLTDEEFMIMKMHTVAGRDIILNAIDIVPDSGYLSEAKNQAEFHHEKWNGSGYPHGLKGEDIPLSARVLAVADVFDALVSKRSYKEPFTFEKAVEIIKEGSGTHFDPKCVEAFLHMLDEIKRIAEDFSVMNNKIYDNGILH